VTPSGATTSAAGNDVLAAQPRALIVTIYGLYARESAGWLSVSAVIRLMAELGVDEPAVRSAISRLKVRGLLEARREAGVAGYGLSARGAEILAQGDRRIFHRPEPSAADGWLLAVFSVSEHERARRQLAGETRDALTTEGLSGYVSLFSADYLAFGDVREKVGQWWDLVRLEQLYQGFINSASPVLAYWQGGGRDEPGPAADRGRAFADYIRVLTAWRRLPFLDPGLPPDLLPAKWDGSQAAELFRQMQTLLSTPARDHVLAVIGEPVV
jgi:phenylacetic acid degradation operon negative regulatory protein